MAKNLGEKLLERTKRAIVNEETVRQAIEAEQRKTNQRLGVMHARQRIRGGLVKEMQEAADSRHTGILLIDEHAQTDAYFYAYMREIEKFCRKRGGLKLSVEPSPTLGTSNRHPIQLMLWIHWN